MRGDPTSARINSAYHGFATGRLTPPCNDCFISLVCPCCSKASDTAPVAMAVTVVAASTAAASGSTIPAATSQARVGAVQRSGSGGNGRGVLCSAAAVVLTDAGGESSHRGGIVCRRRQRGRSEKRRTQTRQHHDRSRHKRWRGARGKHKDSAVTNAANTGTVPSQTRQTRLVSVVFGELVVWQVRR